jgi:hypothetical protein
MAIVSKGSGGSIKFTGTGGGISITSSGGGGGGGGGGSPPMTMLGAWFRADDAGSSNGAAVNSWADRSASGDVLTVPGGFGLPMQPPTYQSSVAAFNNQPAVSFVSPFTAGTVGSQGGSYLAMSSPAAYLAGDSALTIYAVISVDNYFGDAKRIFTYGTLGTYQQRSMISLAATNRWDTKRLGLDVGYGFMTYDFPIPSAAKIVEIRLAQGASSITDAFQAVNGVSQTITDAFNTGGPAIPSPVDQVTMGNGDFDGKIAEIIYYKKEHSSEERAATLSYLSSRYGISV